MNLDSEDEGEIFIGCAGGIDTVIRLPYRKWFYPAHKFAVQVKVKGLQGGHSGDDINKGERQCDQDIESLSVGFE